MFDAFLVADLADGTDHHGQRLRRGGLQHLVEAGHGLGIADLRQGIDGALAHPPVAVPGGIDQLGDRAFVLGLIEDFDGGAADVLVVVLDQGKHRIHHPRTADLTEGVGRPRAHPPVAVGDDLEQVFHGFRGADGVQHLDRRASRVLVFVLEHFDQVFDGVRVFRVHDHVHGLVLHLDLGIAQHAAQQCNVELALHAGEGGQRR